jgi:16S rRNA (guanine966-N2)-methyltransferase
MRITGGTFRSRSLQAPRGSETRPTSDRVREALFSMLAADGFFDTEDGPRVLDLYAGSGALAFEAISRGASTAVLVEHARPALAAIRENTRSLDVGDRVTVVPLKVDRALSAVHGPFDLVFVDPPYADVSTPAFEIVLAKAAELLAPGGTLVLEHASTDEPSAPPGLAVDRRRRHGTTVLSLFHRPGGARQAEPTEAP